MNQNEASHVVPPVEGMITVTSVTAGAATAAITVANATSGAFVSLSIDDGAGGTPLDAYMTVGAAGATPTNPNPTATTGGGRTMRFTAAELARGFVFSAGSKIKLYPIGSGTVYVRQYRSSP